MDVVLLLLCVIPHVAHNGDSYPTRFSLHRHYPFYPLDISSRYDGRLSENTISVRIYAVDCPETGMNLSP
jgi:hypothetical protein